jgi:hypothetical protein
MSSQYSPNMTPRNDNRRHNRQSYLSLLESPHYGPESLPPRDSPVSSLHGEIIPGPSSIPTFQSNRQIATSTQNRLVRDSSLDAAQKEHIVRNHDMTNSFPLRPVSRLIQEIQEPQPRPALVTNPTQLLSANTPHQVPSRAYRNLSTASEDSGNDSVEDGMLAAAHQAQQRRPRAIQRTFMQPPKRILIHDDIANKQPKIVRAIGTDVSDFSDEESVMSAHALPSPFYHSMGPKSAPLMQQLSVPSLKTDKELPPDPRNQTAFLSGSHPLPLGAHPTDKNSILRRAVTLPTKSDRRKLTPRLTPVNTKSGNQSLHTNVATARYHDANDNQVHLPESQTDKRSTEALQTESTVQNIPLISRDARGIRMRIGKISIPEITNRNVPHPRPHDDSDLICIILGEYNRLKGTVRNTITARYPVNIRVIHEGQTHDSNAITDGRISFWTTTTPIDTAIAEEARVASATHRPTTRQSVANIATERKLEHALTKLLQRPSSGRGRTTCTRALNNLMETQEEGNSSRTNRTLGLEVIDSWNATRIGISIIFVLLLSIAATILWVTLGIGWSEQAIGNDGLSVDSSAGWRNAGNRVTGGSMLGLLVLLLGWSFIGLWVALSWLIG